ncbi:uncharacterized protein [Dasypus novemcinctus]|uniref:uncharacterized protein n=1 Tax=Dasypus novemcinctus TaxID=9361 RepID=UPI00265F1AB4|nr:uncharacterized protein LOC101438891 [Dasypus novemcinctus]
MPTVSYRKATRPGSRGWYIGAGWPGRELSAEAAPARAGFGGTERTRPPQGAPAALRFSPGRLLPLGRLSCATRVSRTCKPVAASGFAFRAFLDLAEDFSRVHPGDAHQGKEPRLGWVRSARKQAGCAPPTPPGARHPPSSPVHPRCGCLETATRRKPRDLRWVRSTQVTSEVCGQQRWVLRVKEEGKDKRPGKENCLKMALPHLPGSFLKPHQKNLPKAGPPLEK